MRAEACESTTRVTIRAHAQFLKRYRITDSSSTIITNASPNHNFFLYLDDLPEVVPGVVEGVHGEPGVGVGSHVEALDLLVQLGQGLKVGRGRRKALQELTVSLLQAEDLLQRVAPVRDKARKVRKLALLVFWASF